MTTDTGKARQGPGVAGAPVMAGPAQRYTEKVNERLAQVGLRPNLD